GARGGVNGGASKGARELRGGVGQWWCGRGGSRAQGRRRVTAARARGPASSGEVNGDSGAGEEAHERGKAEDSDDARGRGWWVAGRVGGRGGGRQGRGGDGGVRLCGGRRRMEEANGDKEERVGRKERGKKE
ncbi:hypothetical protein SETIT_5G160300v2, partial [Setaria italica]